MRNCDVMHWQRKGRVAAECWRAKSWDWRSLIFIVRGQTRELNVTFYKAKIPCQDFLVLKSYAKTEN